ncbi:hypothetical protein P692DRAFT_20879279 [Suillus brevipes Sb2]|nr:hypothetical protein P692DRAFT_20879279 [Suillus brevipes Sb2]
MASSSRAHRMGEPTTLFDSFMFDNLGLMPLSGDFVGVDHVDFIGYLILGPEPTLYPLYASCRTTLHAELKTHITLYAYVATSVIHFSAFEPAQSKEVPVFTNSLNPVVEQFGFPPKGTRIGPDNRFYVVYDSVDSNHSTTVVHPARHPIGYYPWSDINFTAFAAMSDAHDTCGPTIDPVCLLPCANVMSDDVAKACSSKDAIVTDAHDGAQQVISTDHANAHTSNVAVSVPPTVYSWISYLVNTVDSAAISTHTDRRSTRSTKKKAKKSAKPEGGLKRIVRIYDNWKTAIAYLWILLRVAVCIGEIDNPFLLNVDRRDIAIQEVWPRALLRANLSVSDLEVVKSANSSANMSHANVLALVNPSLTEFLYDIKHLALYSIGHPHAGFGIDDVAAGVLLTDMVHNLLSMFIRPKSNKLPISENGFAWFLFQQIAKEIMWHIVFRPSETHGIRLVLADLELETFRHSNNPPLSTLSLLGASKYSILMRVPVELLTHYPTTAQVFVELRETIAELINQHDDEGHPEFMANLLRLCNIM